MGATAQNYNLRKCESDGRACYYNAENKCDARVMLGQRRSTWGEERQGEGEGVQSCRQHAV